MKKYTFLAALVLSFAALAHGAQAAVLYSQTVQLSPGWNIFSTPKTLDSHSFSLPENSSNFDIYALNASSTAGWSTLAALGQTEFAPLYGYFINNKSTSPQTLTLNYKAGTSPNARLFNFNFPTTGWYSIGVANPTYAKAVTDDISDTNNPDKVLNSISTSYSSIIDLTDKGYASNPNSVAVSSAWKEAVASDVDSLNDLRETKAYAVYIKNPNAVYSGFQNIDVPLASVSFNINGIAAPNGGAATTTTLIGNHVLLSWSSVNANSCIVVPGNYTGVSGTQSVLVNASTTFNITCSGLYSGTATSSVAVVAQQDTRTIIGQVDAASPAVQNVQISTSAQTQNVVLGVYDLKSSGQAGTLQSLSLGLGTSNNPNNVQIGSIFSNIQIRAVGQTFSATSISNTGASFANLTIPLSADTYVPVTVIATVAQDTNMAFDGITASTSLVMNASNVVVLNQDYANISVTPATLFSNSQTFMADSSPVQSSLNMAAGNVVANNGASSTQSLTFAYNLTAGNVPVYVSKTAASAITVNNAINGATVADVSFHDNDSTNDGSNYFYIAPGQTKTFTVIKSVSGNPGQVAGSYSIVGLKYGLDYSAGNITTLFTLTSSDIGNSLYATVSF